jgi:hypothetical protein
MIILQYSCRHLACIKSKKRESQNMDENTLLKEFEALAVKTRGRSNAISNKIASFLLSEKTAGKKITKIEPAAFDVKEIHIATLYSAIKAGLKVKAEAKVNYVAQKSAENQHYITEAIVKL